MHEIFTRSLSPIRLENQPRIYTAAQHKSMMMLFGSDWPHDIWPTLNEAKTHYCDVLTAANLPVTPENIAYFDGCIRHSLLNFQKYVKTHKNKNTSKERYSCSRGIIFEALSELHLLHTFHGSVHRRSTF